MPWNMNDYPDALQNLNKTTRKKAIDIANALVDEEYEDDRAIPIAIEKAKEWYEDASKDKRKSYLKHGDPTTREKNDHTRASLLDQPEFILPHDDGWAVQAKKAIKPAKVFNKKTDAIDYGKKVAKNKQTSLIIYKENGEIQEEWEA